MPVLSYSMKEPLLDTPAAPLALRRSPFPLLGRRLEELLRFQDASRAERTDSLSEAVEGEERKEED